MSSTLPPPPPPPPPPPSGPPGGPPSGPPSGPPEYLESGGGAPVPATPRSGSAVKKGLLVGGGVIGLAAIGVGAWAAYSFLTTGPQPAEALPADTLGYVSIDLDPSGGQKVEALRTLNKFPSFEDEVGLDTDDDIRKALFDKIQEEAHCDGLDYADDIEPWLGDRAAVAAVDVGGDTPDPVFVIQVKDADAAEKGLSAIEDCSTQDDGAEVGWTIEGDWAVIAETDNIADKVVAATKKGSLADDEDFQHWTDEAGDAGVVTIYAGPAAGDYLADHADEAFGFPLGMVTGATTECYSSGSSDDLGGDGSADEQCSDVMPGDDMCSNGATYDDSGDSPDGVTDPTSLPPCGNQISDDLKQKFREFKGMAATVRFDDGAIELEVAGDSRLAGHGMISGRGTADVVSSLPSDTGAVFGLGFADGWFTDLVDQFAPYTGQTADELLDMMSEETGLDLPADAETLAGDSAAVALGSDLDPDAFFASPDGSDVPVAVKIKGDPDEIEKVLDKLREMAGPDAGVLSSDSDGDTIVVGPSDDYRAEVLKDGDLGDNDVFKDAVREADKASTILFVNVDEFEDAIKAAAGEEDDILENIEPISGFGITAWVDGDTTHAVFRLTTND